MDPRRPEDKRQFHRVPYRKLIEFRHPSYPDTQIHGKTRDLSRTGVQIETAFPLNPGDNLQLKLPIPGRKSGISARVHWSRVEDQNQHYCAGCAFDEELPPIPELS